MSDDGRDVDGNGPVRARTLVDLARRQRERDLAAFAELRSEVRQRRLESVLRGHLDRRVGLHRFSVRNQELILSQDPRASWVYGKKQWEARGRRVRTGARGLWVLAPHDFHRAWPLQAVRVYDVAETEGPPWVPPDLGVGEAGRLVAPVEAAARRLGITLVFRDELPRTPAAVVLGRSLGGTVEVLSRLRGRQRVATLVHEYAHELLHDDGKARTVDLVEVEAEAVAYVVLRGLGVHIDARSEIAFRAGGPDLLHASMRRILSTARLIRTAIDGRRVHLPRAVVVERARRAALSPPAGP